MELRKFKDVMALRPEASAPVVAFHARNLEVAELSLEAWDQLQTTPDSPASDAALELRQWESFDDPSVQSGRLEFGIRNLTLNVTQICNLHCTYCAAGGDGTYGDPVKVIAVEKTLPQIKFFLDQIKPGGHFHIAFLGGEPLLYPKAIEIIGTTTREWAREREISCSFKVTTNGTLITPEALEVLQNLKAHVVVSLDGPAELNDQQRVTKSGQGSFAQAFAGLQALIAHKSGLASLSVHSVFNEKNLQVVRAWETFAPLQIDNLEFTYSVSTPDADASRLYNEQIAATAALAWARGGERELMRIGNFRQIFQQLDEKRRIENHCGLGKTLAVIDARNKIYNCPWTVGRAEDRLGDGTDLDYDKWARHQKPQIETNDCGSCWARYLCGGGCSFIHESTNGESLKKKSDFCDRTRYLSAVALMYYHQSRTATEKEVEHG